MLVKKIQACGVRTPSSFLKNVEMFNVSDFKKMSGRERRDSEGTRGDVLMAHSSQLRIFLILQFPSLL